MLPSLETNLPTLPVPLITPGVRGADSESLNRAFEWFTEAAASLEESYSHLQLEVRGLRDELARKQDELNRERESARQAKALAEISAVLAHEIRNPLAAMELFTDLLLQADQLDGEQLGWVRQLQAGQRALTATVNNVLQMHATNTNSFCDVQMGHVLDSTVQFLSPIAEQTGINILFEDWTQDARVQGDPHRLQQVFLNLAMNAFREMSSGGTFRITASTLWNRGSKQVEIWVQDTGTGILPQHLPHIFEPGFTTRTGGIGLGLPVCRKIIEEHSGNIRVDSSDGAGATFVVTIPCL